MAWRVLLAVLALCTAACQYKEEIGSVPDGTPVFPFANSTCGECLGCCSGPFCYAGNSETTCGKLSAPCQFCGVKQRCVDQACVSCGPANCKGCCDGSGECVAGVTEFDCGTGGAECVFCGAKTCVAGACR